MNENEDLYKIMQELKSNALTATDGDSKSVDVKYLDTITMEEENLDGKILITKDVFAVYTTDEKGNTFIKYYDENKKLLAVKTPEGAVIPVDELFRSIEKGENIGFLDELKNAETKYEDRLSLNEIDEKIETISKELGISKSEVLSMSEMELDQVIENDENKDDKLVLGEKDDEISEEQQAEQNENALENISAKQETNLDRKVDDKHTLAEVLGVESGCKLITVFSDNIKDNENSTRYSFIIQKPDGSLEPASMLEQVGGTTSDKTVYETNKDGSDIEKKSVTSSYSVDSPIAKNVILTVNVGSMGRLEIGYGQTDPTSNKMAVTQELDTNQTYPVTSEVRDQFNLNRGVNRVTEQIDEAEQHSTQEYDNNEIKLENIDGIITNIEDAIENNEHVHPEDVALYIVSKTDAESSIKDHYTAQEIADRYEEIETSHKGMDVKSLVAMTMYSLKEDISRSDEIDIDEIEEDMEREH